MNRKSLISTFAALALAATVQAQIGYQVSLLNTATGEPRANVTVNAQVTITDSQNNTIYSGSQQATTNDFGVLSLAVGDANTFANADTGKMPFFISVSVDGTLVGRSQILNVPVAEVANKLKSSFTKEDLVGTWVSKHYYGDTDIYTFNPDGTAIFIYNTSAPYKRQGEYIIEGDNIHVFLLDTWDTGHAEWSHHIGRFYKSKLIFDSGEFTKQ